MKTNLERFTKYGISPDWKNQQHDDKVQLCQAFEKLIENMELKSVSSDIIQSLNDDFDKALDGDNDALARLPSNGHLGIIKNRLQNLLDFQKKHIT